ncbi:MAG: hypothetical protein AAF724_14925 [Pseudomonadota bacterium]
MFMKDKEVGRGRFRVTKKVIDWNAVLGALVLGGIVIAVLANL